ncbi:MAG: metal ABC transporter ATP-binding protein [Actinomycetota bacterium]
MSGEAVFELRAGTVVLGSAVVVDGVDFTLDTGDFVALLGSNGSGKTTLVRALLGLVPLSAGSVHIFGSPLDRFAEWPRIGYVPQRASVAPGAPASVMEVVLSGRAGRSRRFRPYGTTDRRAAAEALDAVGLSALAADPVADLSGGQQQRVLIARALAGEPEVLVLDEPVSGVDLDHQESFAAILRDFNHEGGTVLLVAHGLGAMEELIGREVVMHAGKVTYEGPHHPHHVHAEHVHHPEVELGDSPLDRAAGGR